MMKNTVKIILSAMIGLLPLLCSAQGLIYPSMPTARLADHSPLFHAIQASRFRTELNTTQQYMALKGHPQTYHLSLAGTPTALTYDHAALTFHGDVYSTHSGFRYDVHGAVGLTANLRVAPDWQLLANLTYDFGYRYYAFHDVVTEHPDYADINYNRYFHTPAVSLGFVYQAREDYRLGFAATGAAALPGNDFSVGGTFFYEQHLGAYTHDAASYYAPFQFDTAVATATGWYRYHVREPYHNGIRTDSLFVWFLSIPTPPGPVIPGDTTLPQSPVPSPASAADIVNLVVLDDHDLTRFKILNLADFERAEATLFDRSGRAIYHSKDYRNDFDFANRTPDTYYYIVALHRGGTVTRQKGFVEVVERK